MVSQAGRCVSMPEVAKLAGTLRKRSSSFFSSSATTAFSSREGVHCCRRFHSNKLSDMGVDGVDGSVLGTLLSGRGKSACCFFFRFFGVNCGVAYGRWLGGYNILGRPTLGEGCFFIFGTAIDPFSLLFKLIAFFCFVLFWASSCQKKKHHTHTHKAHLLLKPTYLRLFLFASRHFDTLDKDGCYFHIQFLDGFGEVLSFPTMPTAR